MNQEFRKLIATKTRLTHNLKNKIIAKDIYDFAIEDINKKLNMKKNERNAGRKKKTNEPYTVRCHPKVIQDVRKYAKEKSKEFINNQKTK